MSHSSGAAEVPEAPLEVLVQEGVEDGVQAAVGVAQSHAEEVGGHDGGGLGHAGRQSFDQDEDVDGGPADHENRHDHQHQAGDAPQVAVLLPWAGKEPDALQAEDHQRVADGDDDEGGHESKDEDTDLHQGVPVGVGLWELQRTLCGSCQREGSINRMNVEMFGLAWNGSDHVKAVKRHFEILR